MRIAPRLLPTLLAAVLVASCGGGGEDTADPGAAASADDTNTDTQTDAAPADVAVASTDLGEILVDGDGMTLYLFTNDPEGQSVCEDGCADAWPPLVVEDAPVAGEGVDAALLGTIERSDGATQVTYDGAPLYTWAQDQEPGDVTGQGVQDVWFVVAPDGSAVTDAADAAAGY